jgi:cobalt-zinc-cadmium efflux system membrane fusion protein
MEHYNMKKYFVTLLLATLFAYSFAHDGDDHGADKKALPGAAKYFSSEALSDKYEVLIKYGELEAKKEACSRCFYLMPGPIVL